MDRRLGLRGQVDLPVVQVVDGFAHECRAVDISCRGVVLARPKRLAEREPSLLYRIEVDLGQKRKILALARPVWTKGRYQALRYVTVSEIDQLEIAELLDQVGRRGAVLH